MDFKIIVIIIFLSHQLITIRFELFKGRTINKYVAHNIELLNLNYHDITKLLVIYNAMISKIMLK